MSTVVLWHFPISHFNEKVRWALDWKRLPHVRRTLGPEYLLRTLWATGQPRLPVLFVDGRAIADSTRIIEALERFQPDPPLYPADAGERARALALEEFFDEELGHPMRTAIVGPLFSTDPQAAVDLLTLGMKPAARRLLAAFLPLFTRYYRARHRIDADAIAAAPGKVRAGLDRIAAELGPSGYLVGGRFSVADLTAAALVSPLLQAPEMQYRLPASPGVIAEYRRELSRHPTFQWAAEMYRRHRGRSAEVAGPVPASPIAQAHTP
jgi:glutathione S-transferase